MALETLGSLALMTLEERCAFVLRAGAAELDAALRTLNRKDPDVYGVMSVERIAWAVAFNVSHEHATPERAAPTRGKRCYLDCWGANQPWSDVWRTLAGPVGADADDRTGLTELAASVACEQRDAWQPVSARPIDLQRAQLAFSTLYERCSRKVAGYVWTQFRGKAGDTEEVAMEAWSRVFVNYWSTAATRRVLGVSAISSLVCGTAYFVGCDLVRRKKQEAVAILPEGPGADKPGQAPHSWSPSGPDEEIEARDLTRHIDACRRGLPARQQIAARLAWDHEMRQMDLARRLGVSPAAVSQLLDKARKGMHKCLKAKGFDVSL